jgi:hypothetical protein
MLVNVISHTGTGTYTSWVVNVGGVTPAASVAWGAITGTLSTQTDLQTALDDKLALAGGTMDAAATIVLSTATNNSLVSGDVFGIELTADPTQNASLAFNALTLQDGAGTMQMRADGLTFPDASTQTVAGIADAPSDGSTYGRKDAGWEVISGAGLLGDQISIYAGYLYNETAGTYVSTLELDPGGTLKADNVTLVSGAGGVLTFADTTTQSTAAIGIPTAGATGQVLKKNSGTNYDVAWANAGGVDVQVFGDASTSGSFTWTKPTGAKWVEFYLVGGGAGGGSGARYATTSARFGGGAGAGSPIHYGRISAGALGGTETVVVGSGGAGGASITTDTTSGNNGTIGTATTFSLFSSGAAQLGSGGTTVAGNAGASRNSCIIYPISASSGGGGTGATTVGNAPGNISSVIMVANGGGGGAGAGASSTTNNNGGNGGGFLTTTSASIISTIAGGTGGIQGGAAATAGTSATTNYFQAGTGGGGGAYKTSTAGGTGGAGGWPGGGGGGGGASDNGYASGAGGAGAKGFACIVTWY